MSRVKISSAGIRWSAALLILAAAVLLLSNAARAEWPVNFGQPAELTGNENVQDGLGYISEEWLVGISDHYYDSLVAMEVDRDGNTYVLSEFSGEVLFEGADGRAESIRSQGVQDFVVAKYDPAGNLEWLVNAGSARMDFARALTLSYDQSGGPRKVRVHVGGQLGGRVNLGGTVLEPPNSGTPTAFVATLQENDEGLPEWEGGSVFFYGVSPTYPTEVTAMDAEPNGDGLYVTVINLVWRLDASDTSKLWHLLPAAISSQPDTPLWIGGAVVGVDDEGEEIAGIHLTDIAYASPTRIFVTGRNNLPGPWFIDIEIPGFIQGACPTGTQLPGNTDFLLMAEEERTTTEVDGLPVEQFSFRCVWAEPINTATTEIIPALDASLDTAYLWYGGRLRSYNEFGEVGIDETFTNNAAIRDYRGVSVGVDDDDNVYVAATYDPAGAPPVTPGAPGVPFPDTDVPLAFVAKRNTDGDWAWVQAPDRAGHPDIDHDDMSGVLALSPSGGAVHLGGFVQGFARFVETNAEGEVSKVSTIISPELPTDSFLDFSPGEGDHLFLPAEPIAGQSGLGLEFRIRLDGAPGSGGTVLSIAGDAVPNNSATDPDAVPGLSVRITSDNILRVHGPSGEEAAWDLNALLGIDVDDGAWRTYTLFRTFIESTVAVGLQVDGVDVTGEFSACAPAINCVDLALDPATDGLGFVIGAELDEPGIGDLGTFDGQLESIGVWSGVPGTPETADAYWAFTDFSLGAAVPDLSGNGHDFVLPGSQGGLAPSLTLDFDGTFDDCPEFPFLTLIIEADCPRPLGYVARLGATDGSWITPQSWVLGQEIPRPGLTIRAEFPRIAIDGLENQAEINSYFSWDPIAQKLYAVGLPPPGLVTITWRDESSTVLNPVEEVRTGIIVPPEDQDLQLYLPGAPVSLEGGALPGNPGQGLRFESVAWPQDASGSASQDITRGWIFRHEPVSSEYAVLRFLQTAGPGDSTGTINDRSHYYLVTRAVSWNNSLFELSERDHLVGREILPQGGEHVDPSGANGFVVFERAPYDGAGATRAYNRATREGQIFPVNTAGAEDDLIDRRMVVAWYRTNAMGLAWPNTTVLYNLVWPTLPADAPPLVISNLQGSGPLEDVAGQVLVYNQPNPNLPGFNPNEEHALVVQMPTGVEGEAPDRVVYALRDDLNAEFDDLSPPYTLVKYRNGAGDWVFEIFRVCRDSDSALCAPDTITEADLFPTYMQPGGPDKSDDPFVWVAGNIITPPAPLNVLGPCGESGIKPGGDPNEAGWNDVDGNLWARASNYTEDVPYDAGVSGHTVFHFYYPLRSDFYHGVEEDTNFLPTGECLPWLPDANDVPVDVAYEFAWPDPDTIPVLDVGDTLYQPRLYLPNTPGELAFPTFKGQEAAQVIFDEATFNSKGTGPYLADTPSLVRLLAPTVERKVDLAEFGLSRLPDDAQTFNRNGREYFGELPTLLRGRLSYDPINNDLIFAGSITEPLLGDPQVLPNIMTVEDRDAIQSLVSASADFDEAVAALYHKTRNPNDLALGGGSPDEAFLVGLDITPPEAGDLAPDGSDARIGDPNPDPAEPERLAGVPMMLSANLDAGEGYVTVALNNHENASAPVELHILQVSGCQAYKGNIWVVPTDNVFEEAITLRHTGLFGGQPDQVELAWYIQPDSDGQPDVPLADPLIEGWSLWQNNLDGNNNGLDITIEGPNITTLRDNWVVAQYTGSNDRICEGSPVPLPDAASEWAGDPTSYSSSDPSVGKAMLALGWIKRVIAGLNPFDSRVRNFHDDEASTLASLIAQAGAPFNGPIPFNPDGDVINSIGIIEAYETILRRGRELSVDAVDPQTGDPAPINDVAANNQLLNVSTRIGDLYMLLCNEAFADAADPTIGFDTGSEVGTLASSIFTFQNQLASPLEEELNLLRGRDGTRANVGGYPLFNRLPWNFTQGEGEIAYVQSYRITDQDVDGFITEEDAAYLFPQGHGDAWGHCLTALKTRYDLLQEPDFTWVPRTESVLVGGGVVEVDYLDERKFAAAAAAKARIGAEVVNLTYRDKYVEDPAGQWQGYKDTAQNAGRAWGMDGWARRAGQGAYFDWLTANAILPPEDPDPSHEGIQKIDRTTVEDLGQIAAQFGAVQGQMDRADAGLNPIGLAKGVIPFDIDPNFNEVGSGNQGQTHFEQIAERAQDALNNLVAVFDHASQQTQALRNVQDDVDALEDTRLGQERDFKNRLIEIFGYPYADDPDTPPGYDGPDLYKYMYVNSDLTGDLPQPDGSFTGFYSQVQFGDQDSGHYFTADLAAAADNAGETLEQEYPVATGADWPFIAPGSWGRRRAPGELQLAISDVLQAQAEMQRAFIEHENLLEEVEDARDLVIAEYDLQEETIRLLETQRDTEIGLNVAITAAHIAGLAANRTGTIMRDAAEATGDAVPKSVGLATDAFSAVRGAIKGTFFSVANGFEILGDAADVAELGLGFAKDLRAQNTEIQLVSDTPNVDLQERLKELEQLWRQEAGLRVELFTQAEAVEQSVGRYYQLLAEGQRILEERRLFRVTTAAETQQYRYRDATFRIFRNDALQKYRSQFDLTARYIYLAAAAYDFETSQESAANGSGRQFLADIVRERVPGQVVDGAPVAGTPGLADVLARLQQNFAVYEGQLGFNNPQIETNRFSMRREWLKLLEENDAAWRNKLAESRVDDLWQVPEFRRYSRAFVGESAGPQPGIVLRFPSTVTFGKNFFDQNLGAGDSAYDSSNFATKIRSAGTWFENYATSALSNTPRIYLFPVLQDVMRTPTNDASITREWSVVDQKLPVPFPVGPNDLNDIDWVPSSDSLSDSYGDIRRFSSFRAYHDSGEFDPLEVSSDTRLIGRSVWNNGWVMIIPGGTLLFNPDEGLDRFIYGRLMLDAPAGCSNPDRALRPPPEECRDLNGVKDIKLFFQTYGYSGN